MKYDSSIGRFLTRICDLLMLNLIFIVMSLPIVTIGANMTALYGVTLQMAKNEHSSIVKLYFDKFKENVKQATIIWLLILFFVSFLLFDIHLLKSASMDEIRGFLVPVIYVFLGVFAVYFLMAFPLIAKFENTTKEVIRNTLLVALGYLPQTIMMAGLTFGPMLIAVVWWPEAYGLMLFVYLLIGIALTAYMNAIFLNQTFDKLLAAQSAAAEESSDILQT